MRSAADLVVLEAIAAGEAERDFVAFRRFMDPDLLPSWWQEDAARHLQQFAEDMAAGKRPKLVICCPPQHGKSELTVDFIAWRSAKWPDTRTIFASYSERLGVRANMSLQRKFELPRFQRAFPEPRLAGQAGGEVQRNRDIIEFTGRRGYFRNTTVLGSITGETADLLVIDDPIKSREEANSELVRERTWDWFVSDLLTRQSSRSGVLVIATRWHTDDPIARLITSDPSVKVLTYRAVAEEGDEQRTDADMANRKPGEALFPELKPLEFLQAQQRMMDAPGWSSLYQCRPTVQGGNLFKLDDFKRHRHGEARPYERRMIFADTAQKTGQQHDYSVLQCWGLGNDGVAYLIDQVRGKFEAPELLEVARTFWRKHQSSGDSGYLTQFCIEDAVSGTGLIQQLRWGDDIIPLKALKRTKDKYSRALDALPSIASGLVSIPADAPFTRDLLAELATFPAGAHDDQVDPLLDAVAELLLTKYGGYNWDAWDDDCPADRQAFRRMRAWSHIMGGTPFGY